VVLEDMLSTTLFQVDDEGLLFISPAISDWGPINARGIQVVIDLEGGIDHGVSTRPGHMLYVYHPVYDEHLPDLEPFHAVARMAAGLIRQRRKVLSHCGLGFNRSAFMAGLIMTELGMPGAAAVERIRERRPGALFNDEFAAYLLTLSGRA
jgi:protein-tyrosine phosphatase